MNASVLAFCNFLDIFHKKADYLDNKLKHYIWLLYSLLIGGCFGIILSPSALFPWLGAAFGFFVYVSIKFLIRRFPLVIKIIGTALVIPIVPFLIEFLYTHIIDISNPNFGLDVKLMFITVSLGCLVGCLILIYKLPDLLKRLFSDKDQFAHLLFLLSMAALGWALWLQSGGNWQQMASLNSPITLPGFDPIPFTASISFPFALLGWIENSAGSALSFASAASTNEILALFASAAVLFFFASNRIQLSAVGVRPEFALLAFALFWVSVLFDVALHWHSAPVLPPVLILFNRAFAVLALCVSLFWRNAAKRGEDVPGADGEYRKACDAAEQTARKIGLWLLALVWLATQLSHENISPVAFYWIKAAMIGVFVAIPLRLMIQFKSDFQKALGRYNQLLALWQQSYKPPPTVATDAQVRDALNGGRGIGGKDWNDTGE